MNEIANYMGHLGMGEMQEYKNMAVIPLFDTTIRPLDLRKRDLEYLVLDEALRNGLRIEETKHVPELYFENKSGKDVLILMGEYVVGGWQNRMVATNVLLEDGFRGMVPVKCVQQHRWSNNGHVEPYILYERPTDEGGRVIDTAKFSASSKRASPSIMSACLHDGQSGVWNEVSNLMGSFGTRSATKNIEDLYDHKKHELADYLENFSCLRDSVGMIIATPNGDGSKRYSIELFDQDATMEKHFSKLIESYALEAIAGKKELHMRQRELSSFFDDVKEALDSGICTITGRKPVSLGKDLEITSPEFEGYSLVHRNMPAYTTFCSEKYRHKEEHPWYTGIRRPNMPNTDPGDFPIRVHPLPYPAPAPKPTPKPLEPPRDFPPYDTPNVWMWDGKIPVSHGWISEPVDGVHKDQPTARQIDDTLETK